MPRPTRLRSLRADAGFRFERLSSSGIGLGYWSSTRTRWRTFLSIPATSGVSGRSTVRPILPRPRARSVPRWRSLWPIWLRTCVIRSFLFGIARLLRRRDGGDGLLGRPLLLRALRLLLGEQQDPRGAVLAENLMRDRGAVLRHREEVLLRVLDGL